MRTWLKAAIIACLMEAVLIAPLFLYFPNYAGTEEPRPIQLIEWYRYVSFVLAYGAGVPKIRRLLGDDFQLWLFMFTFQVVLTTPVIFLLLRMKARRISK